MSSDQGENFMILDLMLIIVSLLQAYKSNSHIIISSFPNKMGVIYVF